MTPEKRTQVAYLAYLRNHQQRPPSLDALAFDVDNPPDPRAYYLNRESVEQAILLETFLATLERLETSEEYAVYTIREKVLAFFFTWFEELETIRESVQVLDRAQPTDTLLPLHLWQTPSYLKSVDGPFQQYIAALLVQGRQRGELAQLRPLSSQHPVAFWHQLRWIFNLWLEDHSAERQRTDAAVEKAVNFAFDYIEPNVFDSGIDLARFFLAPYFKR